MRLVFLRLLYACSARVPFMNVRLVMSIKRTLERIKASISVLSAQCPSSLSVVLIRRFRWVPAEI